MFTEGLDERALDWVKQSSEFNQGGRRPLVEKLTMDGLPSSPSMYKTDIFSSPRRLPPVRFHSGFLETRMDMERKDEDDESVASVPDEHFPYSPDTFGEGSLISSDSDAYEKMKERRPSLKQSLESVKGSSSINGNGLTRGPSKENLRIEVLDGSEGQYAMAGAPRTSLAEASIDERDTNGLAGSCDYVHDDLSSTRVRDLGTPSAPPMVESERVGHLVREDEKRMVYNQHFEASQCDGLDSQVEPDSDAKHTSEVENIQMPNAKTIMKDQIPCFTTSVQNAWQSFVAYDACFRLCLNAWARNCMEAPEFLRDECVVLRNAFGIQNYLLPPRGQSHVEGRPSDNSKGASLIKGRRGIDQIEVEVRKIQVFSKRRSLQDMFPQRSLYLQIGAHYARNVSGMLKRQISSIKMNAFPDDDEEVLSCSLHLKSSITNASLDSPVILRPGSGDSHVFHLESQGDSLLVQVKDIDKTHLGHANIQISSLADLQQGELIKWWPLYLEENECVGKVQLVISVAGAANKTSTIKGGIVAETLIYDLVLEATLRAQNFNAINLQISDTWRWLLHEFSLYYGVSDTYTKLRYLSCIMNIAIPTKDCLELIYELLLPAIKAMDDKIMNRQERSIFLDCEDQIKGLLATVFENYKSLDESSPGGLSEYFDAVPESAAPALSPAVQIFTLIYDILSSEAQNTLRNYLQTAAMKRCRRYMMETDEFMSSNNEGFFFDPVTVSTAYLKMKGLCAHVSDEIRSDIKIHNQHILPSSIDLPNIVASVYNIELSRRIRGFLAACPPPKPSPHVMELLIATSEFERNLQQWKIAPVNGGVDPRDLFHGYIVVWIQDTELRLVDLCKAEKSCSSNGVTMHYCTSTFVENIYDNIRESLNEYEVVINRWPQYLMGLENVVSNVERAVLKTLERQNNEVLVPLRDGIPKILEKHMQKLIRGQPAPAYVIPPQLGTFINTIRRVIDVLHFRVEGMLRSWSSYLSDIKQGNCSFGEQMNGVTVVLRKKYKKYMEAVVEKLISNTRSNRSTWLKRILEDTKEAEGEAEIRERMQGLCLQILGSIRNMHGVFSSQIFIAVCRCFWDRMGQIVLSFLESRKENRVWYRASDYALGILDDLFASEMQTLLGNSVQAKDLEPPRSVDEARSILY